MNRSAVALLLLLFVLLISCCTPREEYKQPRRNKAKIVQPEYDRTERMIIMEDEALEGIYYTIIKVDGHEYLTSIKGGFIHLESCKHEEDKQTY